MGSPTVGARESRVLHPVAAPVGGPCPSAVPWDDGRGGDDGAGQRRPLFSLLAAGRPLSTSLVPPRERAAAVVRQQAGGCTLLELVERERAGWDPATGLRVLRDPAVVAYRMSAWYQMPGVTVGQVAELLLQRLRTPVRPVGTAPG